jgi:hypothetical protein
VPLYERQDLPAEHVVDGVEVQHLGEVVVPRQEGHRRHTAVALEEGAEQRRGLAVGDRRVVLGDGEEDRRPRGDEAGERRRGGQGRRVGAEVRREDRRVVDERQVIGA